MVIKDVDKDAFKSKLTEYNMNPIEAARRRVNREFKKRAWDLIDVSGLIVISIVFRAEDIFQAIERFSGKILHHRQSEKFSSKNNIHERAA